MAEHIVAPMNSHVFMDFCSQEPSATNDLTFVPSGLNVPPSQREAVTSVMDFRV
jgi:hypothetical protein